MHNLKFIRYKLQSDFSDAAEIILRSPKLVSKGDFTQRLNSVGSKLSKAGIKFEQTVHPMSYGEVKTILRSQFKTT